MTWTTKPKTTGQHDESTLMSPDHAQRRYVALLRCKILGRGRGRGANTPLQPAHLFTLVFSRLSRVVMYGGRKAGIKSATHHEESPPSRGIFGISPPLIINKTRATGVQAGYQGSRVVVPLLADRQQAPFLSANAGIRAGFSKKADRPTIMAVFVERGAEQRREGHTPRSNKRGHALWGKSV